MTQNPWRKRLHKLIVITGAAALIFVATSLGEATLDVETPQCVIIKETPDLTNKIEYTSC